MSALHKFLAVGRVTVRRLRIRSGYEARKGYIVDSAVRALDALDALGALGFDGLITQEYSPLRNRSWPRNKYLEVTARHLAAACDDIG